MFLTKTITKHLAESLQVTSLDLDNCRRNIESRSGKDLMVEFADITRQLATHFAYPTQVVGFNGDAEYKLADIRNYVDAIVCKTITHYGETSDGNIDERCKKLEHIGKKYENAWYSTKVLLGLIRTIDLTRDVETFYVKRENGWFIGQEYARDYTMYLDIAQRILWCIAYGIYDVHAHVTRGTVCHDTVIKSEGVQQSVVISSQNGGVSTTSKHQKHHHHQHNHHHSESSITRETLESNTTVKPQPTTAVFGKSQTIVKIKTKEQNGTVVRQHDARVTPEKTEGVIGDDADEEEEDGVYDDFEDENEKQTHRKPHKNPCMFDFVGLHCNRHEPHEHDRNFYHAVGKEICGLGKQCKHSKKKITMKDGRVINSCRFKHPDRKREEEVKILIADKWYNYLNGKIEYKDIFKCPTE